MINAQIKSAQLQSWVAKLVEESKLYGAGCDI